MVILVSALGGLAALIAAGVAWRKVLPEKDSIVVNAAQGALIVQSGVLEDLRAELERTSGRIDELEGKLTETRKESSALRETIRGLEQDNARLTSANERLDRDNVGLRARVAELESRVNGS